jgi:hypothetical protein
MKVSFWAFEHLGAAGGRQLIELQGQVPVPCADPSISIKRRLQLPFLKLRYERCARASAALRLPKDRPAAGSRSTNSDRDPFKNAPR